MSDILLDMKGIGKSFPGVRALDGVDFSVRHGEIVCLLGENGAGKSTLMKILAGVYTADAGTMHLDGRHIAPATPLLARKLGIAMVHQELAFFSHRMEVIFQLCDTITVLRDGRHVATEPADAGCCYFIED